MDSRQPNLSGAVRDHRAVFRLGAFPGYDKGRSSIVLAAWILTLELVFKRWWCPRRLRPTLLRAFGAKVGSGVLIREGVHITWPWNITIGDDVWIGRGVEMLTSTKITIGHDVCISQQAMILTSGHDPNSADFRVYDFPVTIGNHVWVASRAMVLHRVKLPDHTIVPAGAVVSFGTPIRFRDQT